MGAGGWELSLNHLIRGQEPLTQIHITASYLGTFHCWNEIDLYGQPSMDKLFSYLSLNESRQESMLSDPWLVPLCTQGGDNMITWPLSHVTKQGSGQTSQSGLSPGKSFIIETIWRIKSIFLVLSQLWNSASDTSPAADWVVRLARVGELHICWISPSITFLMQNLIEPRTAESPPQWSWPSSWARP